jgi:hypothetical protein
LRASSALLGLCVMAWSGGAPAQWAVAAEGGLTRKSDNEAWGAAVDGRFGVRFGLPREFIIHTLICQPELVVGYRSLPWAGANAVRFGAGGRIGFLIAGLEPFAFGHYTAAEAGGDWGSVGDVGAALDYRLETWSFGYHYAREFVHVHHVNQAIDDLGIHVEIRGYWF